MEIQSCKSSLPTVEHQWFKTLIWVPVLLIAGVGHDFPQDTLSVFLYGLKRLVRFPISHSLCSVYCSFSFLYVMIVLKGSVPISFGGTEQPAAYGELVSIGGLGPDVNKKLSAAVAAILETKLSVPKNRFFLKFYDTKASASESRICTVFACFTSAIGHGSNFGWNGSTF
ncbi:macrophage migration inhibitory factor [Trifolium pratense]|uniref:Macrophage migration inhibitory factor n=1 Tax=Trifolium pratense TaxID=57577 RepID=A0A2K3L3Y1_TRIPR|nr:macrophage migration inhibitory factor [Trifolium pratense]